MLSIYIVDKSFVLADNFFAEERLKPLKFNINSKADKSVLREVRAKGLAGASISSVEWANGSQSCFLGGIRQIVDFRVSNAEQSDSLSVQNNVGGEEKLVLHGSLIGELATERSYLGSPHEGLADEFLHFCQVIKRCAGNLTNYNYQYHIQIS